MEITPVFARLSGSYFDRAMALYTTPQKRDFVRFA
jgi:hypothetical protein